MQSKRKTYSNGYALRQSQREYAFRLLENGFTPFVVAGYVAKNYAIKIEEASRIVKYVVRSLEKVRHNHHI